MITHLVLSVKDVDAQKVIDVVLPLVGVTKVGVYEDMNEADFVFEKLSPAS